MDEHKLDGNAAAGILQAIFSVEITTAAGTCEGCGAVEPVGAVAVYVGAGTVLRCPHCDHVLAKVVVDGDRVWVELRGLRSLALRL